MLTNKEIEFIAYKWIGVNGGYLGDFSYRTHKDFYFDYCGLENIDPDLYEGTTRARFQHILKISNPKVQAKILKGILERFPKEAEAYRTNSFENRIIGFIERCETSNYIESKTTGAKTESIDKAIEDSNLFIETDRPVSAVDRLHTAFHGYLLEICNIREIEIPTNSTITKVFKQIRLNCPEFKKFENHSEEVKKILNSLSSIVDSINNIRNNGSIAHPNEKLLSNETASLYINTVRTLLNFISSKIKDVDR